MAPRGNCVCGLDINREHICVAQYMPTAQTVLNASLIVNPIGESGFSDKDVIAFKPDLKKLVSAIRASGQKAVISAPADLAVVKKLDLDKNETGVRETIEWELSQQIIGTMDDYVYDFEPCDDDGDDVKRYIAVSYKSSIIQKYTGLCRASGLIPMIVDLDMFALINVFEANYPDMASAPAFILHGRKESTAVILTQGGTFVDFEIIEHPSGLSSPDFYAGLIHETIGRSFRGMSYPIVCTGSPFSQPDFAESVRSRLENAQMLNPFAVIHYKIDVPENELQKFLPLMAVAVGLALRGPV
jgi:Tfp pilus assembly PilM family ATPase